VLIGTVVTAIAFTAWDGWYRWPFGAILLAGAGLFVGASWVAWLAGARRRPRWRRVPWSQRSTFVYLAFTSVAGVGLGIIWPATSDVVTSTSTATAIERPDHAAAQVLAATPIVFVSLLAAEATLRGDLLAGRSLDLRRVIVVAVHAVAVILLGLAVALAPALPADVPIVQSWSFGTVILTVGVLLWLGGSPWLLIAADSLYASFAALALLQSVAPDDTELALVRLAGSSVAAISLLAAGVAITFVALIAAAGVAPPAMSAPVARSFATIESWLHSGEET
jgi:hypothetical protein